MSESKIPNVPTCAVCGRSIPVGTGKFLAAAPGEPVTKFVHNGPCAAQAGAVPGGSVAFGEIAELTGAAIEGRDPVVTSSEGGFAVVDLLFTALQVALLLFAVVCVGRIVVHRGGFEMPVAQAEASIVAADHVPGGVSR